MAKKKIPKPNKRYTLVEAKRGHDWRILAFDPGSRNMGISCVGVKNDKLEVIASAIMMNPITSMTNNHVTLRAAFEAEIQEWLDLYEPDAVIMERFQARGGKGPLIELVTTMNALISKMDTSLPYKFVMPATWKNAWHRRFVEYPLDEVYKQCLTTAHQFDSILIGCYGLELALRKQLRYTPESIVLQAERTSRLPLRRPR